MPASLKLFETYIELKQNELLNISFSNFYLDCSIFFRKINKLISL